MSRPTKILLVLTVITLPPGLLFVTGVLSVGDAQGLHVLFPFGAIFFGLFLIFWMMEKEVAKFEAEQRRPHEPVERAGNPVSCHDGACHSPGRA